MFRKFSLQLKLKFNPTDDNVVVPDLKKKPLWHLASNETIRIIDLLYFPNLPLSLSMLLMLCSLSSSFEEFL